MRLDVHPKTGEIVFDLIGLTGFTNVDTRH